jgi:hypothetical protein
LLSDLARHGIRGVGRRGSSFLHRFRGRVVPSRSETVLTEKQHLGDCVFETDARRPARPVATRIARRGHERATRHQRENSCCARKRIFALPLHVLNETMRPLPIEPPAGVPPFVRGMSIIASQAWRARSGATADPHATTRTRRSLRQDELPEGVVRLSKSIRLRPKSKVIKLLRFFFTKSQFRAKVHEPLLWRSPARAIRPHAAKTFSDRKNSSFFFETTQFCTKDFPWVFPAASRERTSQVHHSKRKTKFGLRRHAKCPQSRRSQIHFGKDSCHPHRTTS